MVLLLPKAFQAFAAMSVDRFPDEKWPPKSRKSIVNFGFKHCQLHPETFQLYVLLLASQCE